MSLATDRLRSLSEAVRAAAQATTLDALGREAFPKLAAALDASAAVMFLVKVEQEGPRPQALAGEARALFAGYMESVAAEDPLFRASAANERPIHLPLRHVEVAEFRRSRAYSDFYGAHGFADKLYMRFAGAHLTDDGATSMGFLRPARLPSFADRDIELAGLALPAFEGAARRIARAGRDLALGSLEALACANAPHATLALDAMGRLLWVSPPAERLLGPALARRSHLPDGLVSAARRLGRFALTRELDFTTETPFSVRFDRGDGVLLDAELSIARTSQGTPIVAVGIEQRDRPRTLVRETTACFALTPSEADVLGLVSRGLSNEDISSFLHVSLATVKTHLTRVFRKLGVGSRVQAALLARKVG